MPWTRPWRDHKSIDGKPKIHNICDPIMPEMTQGSATELWTSPYLRISDVIKLG